MMHQNTVGPWQQAFSKNSLYYIRTGPQVRKEYCQLSEHD